MLRPTVGQRKDIVLFFVLFFLLCFTFCLNFREVNVHNIYIILLQQIINDKLLLVII